jgi:hypothetical protein
MTLNAQEFLRRFLLHVLPRGLVRIRSFGFLANRRRATLLPLCQRLLAHQPMPHPSAAASGGLARVLTTSKEYLEAYPAEGCPQPFRLAWSWRRTSLNFSPMITRAGPAT